MTTYRSKRNLRTLQFTAAYAALFLGFIGASVASYAALCWIKGFPFGS